MQTVNSKKKKEKEKLRRYIATLVGLVQGSRETLFEELLLSRCFPGRVVWRPELGLKAPLTAI